MNFRTTPSSYRAPTAPSYSAVDTSEPPTLRRLMIAGLLAFVLISLLVLLAGRVPFPPQPGAPVGTNTAASYQARDRELLKTYGYTMEGKVHIPITEAMRLIVERQLPVAEATATPKP